MPSLPTKNRRYYLGERTDLLEWHGVTSRASSRGRMRGGWQCAVVARAWCQEPGGRRDPPGECHAGARRLRSCGVATDRTCPPIADRTVRPHHLRRCPGTPRRSVGRSRVASARWQRTMESFSSQCRTSGTCGRWRASRSAGFRPESEGIFDATHLHFFTKDNIAQLLVSGGWEPRALGIPVIPVTVTRHPRDGARSHALGPLSCHARPDG